MNSLLPEPLQHVQQVESRRVLEPIFITFRELHGQTEVGILNYLIQLRLVTRDLYHVYRARTGIDVQFHSAAIHRAFNMVAAHGALYGHGMIDGHAP